MRALLASAGFAALTMLSARADATACTSGADCPSGFCANAVCCDRACDGVCEACAAVIKTSGDDGTCGPAKKGRTCGEGACAAGIETSPPTCDGEGTCGAGASAPCRPYACDGARCRKTCRANDDCAAGYVCDEIGKACVPADTCDGDHTLTTAGGTKDCSPFKCARSDCLRSCVSSAQCVAPNDCRSGQCVPTATLTPSNDDGGCALTGRSPRRGTAALTVTVLLVAGLRRARMRRERASRG